MGGGDTSHLVHFLLEFVGRLLYHGLGQPESFLYTRFRSRWFVHMCWGRYTSGVHSLPIPAAADLMLSHRSQDVFISWRFVYCLQIS